MEAKVFGEQLPIIITRDDRSFTRSEWKELRESVNTEDWETIGFSIDPAGLILEALPPACNMCRPAIDAKVESLGTFLFERIASVAKAAELVMQEQDCVHIG